MREDMRSSDDNAASVTGTTATAAEWISDASAEPDAATTGPAAAQ